MGWFQTARNFFFKQHDNLGVSRNLIQEARRAFQNSSLCAADLILDGHLFEGNIAIKEARALARVCALLEQRKSNEGPLQPADHNFLRENLRLLRSTNPSPAKGSSVPTHGNLWNSYVVSAAQSDTVESSMCPQYAHGLSLRRTHDLLPKSER